MTEDAEIEATIGSTGRATDLREAPEGLTEETRVGMKEEIVTGSIERVIRKIRKKGGTGRTQCLHQGHLLFPLKTRRKLDFLIGI
jgi:hypothetical protein